MLRLLAALLVLGTVLAGCSGGGGDDGEVVIEDVPELEATPSTGVIRAVVVDEAIRPIAGANVSVTGPNGPLQRVVTTGEDGFAGFEGLAPGTYFVKAQKSRYVEAQQSVEVVAGVDDPPVAKLQLSLRLGDQPFVTAFKIDGFLECSAIIGNWCFIANYYPCFVMQTAGQPCTGNLTNDNSYFVIDGLVRDLQRVPDWYQMEMVWESTQALGTEMNVRLDFLSGEPGDSFTIDNATSETGTSPLLLDVDAEELEENEIGTTRYLAIETFHGGDVGVTLQQRFTDFIHIFYGYEPPEGWRFSADGTVPDPP